MSIYPGVSQIYTSCCWVHLSYHCVSVCIYPGYDLESHGRVRRWVCIQDPRIWIQAYNQERQDVCVYGSILQAWLVSWIKCVVKHKISWPQNGIHVALHSAKGHCCLQYTETYENHFDITSLILSSFPALSVTVHLQEKISTDDNDYRSTRLPIWLTTTLWQQFRIIE